MFIPVGVGALAAAVCRHYRASGHAAPPLLVSVEPSRAACLLASRPGRPVTIPEPQHSIMAGLNCGTPSPFVSAGLDLMLAINDELAYAGMRDSAALGIAAGECSGGGAAGALLTGPYRPSTDAAGHPLIFLTERPTDPERYRQIVGRKAEEVLASSVPPLPGWLRHRRSDFARMPS